MVHKRRCAGRPSGFPGDGVGAGIRVGVYFSPGKFRKGKLAGQPFDPKFVGKSGPDPFLTRLAQLPAPRRFGDQAGQGPAQFRPVAAFDQDSGLFVRDQLWDRRYPGGDTGQTLALRFHQDVGQAIPVAITRDPAGKDKNIGFPIGRQDRLLRLRTAPGDLVRDARPFCLSLQFAR